MLDSRRAIGAPTNVESSDLAPNAETTAKRVARIALIVSTCAIALGYASAFAPGGAPIWGAWLLALGIPVALGGIMVLGASRGRSGIGRLVWPFAFVIVTLVVGFSLALALPANESVTSNLWLGLPLRAAVILYGIGLLPIVVLPVAYALTFETQTLSAADVELVRQMGQSRRDSAPESPPDSTRDSTREPVA